MKISATGMAEVAYTHWTSAARLPQRRGGPADRKAPVRRHVTREHLHHSSVPDSGWMRRPEEWYGRRRQSSADYRRPACGARHDWRHRVPVDSCGNPRRHLLLWLCYLERDDETQARCEAHHSERLLP